MQQMDTVHFLLVKLSQRPIRNGDFGSKTTGILSTIDITEGGSNYSVGDDIVVSGGNGSGLKFICN